MSISKENPTKNDFEELYQNKNPWNFDGTLNDLIRLKILNNLFKDTYFQRGLDVACGEGFLTAQLNFVENKFGVDISEKAIHRAKMLYENVTFESGDAFKNYTTDSKFDFISCFEALYYPSSNHDRKSALKNLMRLGNLDATYAFSVVTTGESKYRKYFTKTEFTEMLNEVGYKVKTVVGFVIEGSSVSLPFRLFRKIVTLLLPQSISVLILEKIITKMSDNFIYQHLFICTRN